MKYTISPRDAADALTAIRDILFRVEPADQENDCPTLDPDKELDYSDALQAIAGAFQALDLAPVRGDEPASSIGIAPAHPGYTPITPPQTH